MRIPDHMFLADDGNLYDCRIKGDRGMMLLREGFSRHHGTINNLAQLKATLRAGEFAFPGGYPLYFMTSDGAALSFTAVKSEFRNVAHSMLHLIHDGWYIVACAVNYEDSDLLCDHTGQRIESAYGES